MKRPGFFLSIALVMLGCGSPAVDLGPGPVVAHFQGKPIQLGEAVQSILDSTTELVDAKGPQLAMLHMDKGYLETRLQDWLRDECVYQDAVQTGFPDRGDVHERLGVEVATARDHLIQAAVERHFAQTMPEFEITEPLRELRLRMIVIQDYDRDALEKLSQSVLAKAKSGEDFKRLVNRYSAEPETRGRDGDMGWFHRGQMDPESESALFALAKGGISELMHTDRGWRIFKITDIQDQPLERRRLSTIFIPFYPPPSENGERESRARERINIVKAKLGQGQSLSSMAKEYSDDVSTREALGGIGARGMLAGRDDSLSWIPQASWYDSLRGLEIDLWDIPLSKSVGPYFTLNGTVFLELVARRELPPEEIRQTREAYMPLKVEAERVHILQMRDAVYEDYLPQVHLEVDPGTISSKETDVSTVLIKTSDGKTVTYGSLAQDHQLPDGTRLQQKLNDAILNLAFQKKGADLGITDLPAYKVLEQAVRRQNIIRFYNQHLLVKFREQGIKPTEEDIQKEYETSSNKYVRRTAKVTPFEDVEARLRAESGIQDRDELKKLYEKRVTEFADVKIEPLPLESVREKIIEKLSGTKVDDAVKAYIDDLVKKYEAYTDTGWFSGLDPASPGGSGR